MKLMQQFRVSQKKKSPGLDKFTAEFSKIVIEELIYNTLQTSP
jgi:hypothetical protein